MPVERTIWGIVAHAQHPIRIIGGTNTECRNEAAIREQLPAYRCLRIVPEGQPYGETPVRHRVSGEVGTALRIVPGNRNLPDWAFHHKDWVQVRWDDGLVCHNTPDELEWMEEADALASA